MEIIYDLVRYAGYFAITIIGIATLAIAVISLTSKGRSKDTLEIVDLNKEHDHLKTEVSEQILTKKEFKIFSKKHIADKKNNSNQRKRLFVLEFKGDIKASEVESLRKEITTALSVCESQDEILLKLESPGGMVHTYGLAAAQLERIKDAGLKLTVCVDRVAASGGYMMACVADQIIAAPFAMIGSIGVVAQVPNFHKLLKKHDVDYHEITAGQYKRTLTLFGEVTSEKLHKFSEQIQDIHSLFKNFIEKNRPTLDLARVATGEYWYGLQARELGLIDKIQTSDEVILEKIKLFSVYSIKIREKKSVSDRLSEAIETSLKQFTSHLSRKLTGDHPFGDTQGNQMNPLEIQHKAADPLV